MESIFLFFCNTAKNNFFLDEVSGINTWICLIALAFTYKCVIFFDCHSRQFDMANKTLTMR